jgi:hypothetical protein
MAKGKRRLRTLTASEAIEKLASLPRTPFGPLESAHQMWELQEHSSDRVCAVVLGASIHSQLQHVVQTKFIVNKAKARALIGFDGPLGNFRLLADFAHATGMISDDVWNDLTYVRKIRNAFAHTVTALDSTQKPQRISFAKTDEVKDFAANLKCPNIIMRNDERPDVLEQFQKDVREGRRPTIPYLPPPTDPRERFEFTCRWLSNVLLSIDRLDTMLIAQSPRDYPNYDYSKRIGPPGQ